MHHPASSARLLLLGAHRWNRQAVIRLARLAGFDVVLLAFDGEVVALPDDVALPSLTVIRQPPLTPPDAAGIVQQLQSADRAWFALGLDDYVCMLGAQLADLSSHPTMNPVAARDTLHKHLLRGRWNALCRLRPRLFPVPFSMSRFTDTGFHSLERIEGDLPAAIEGPLIVKPNALDASIGITWCLNREALPEAIDRVCRELSSLAPDVVELGINIAPEILIEIAIPRATTLHSGAEFSAEFISSPDPDGQSISHTLLGITQKHINSTTFVELAHCFPADSFPDELRDELVVATSHLLDQLGAKCCLSHWEYIITNDHRLALVEAQMRPAGDYIINLIERSTGTNPYHALFAALRGEDAKDYRFSPQKTAAVFFPKPREPVGGPLNICFEDEEVKSVVGSSLFVSMDIQNATRWDHSGEWSKRFVATIGEGASYAEAKLAAEGLVRRIKVRGIAGGEFSSVDLVLPV